MSITDRDISSLRQSAGVAGDIIQVVICNVALGEVDVSDEDALDEDGLPDYSGGGHDADDLRKIRAWLRSSQEEAWAECERVILDARAEAEYQERA